MSAASSAKSGLQQEQMAPKTPLQGSLMGLPLELRLAIYDFYLPSTVTYGSRKSTSFRILFNINRQVRRELMQHSLLRRKLEFDLCYYDEFKDTDEVADATARDPIERSIGWLSLLAPEEKGQCRKIQCNMTYTEFDALTMLYSIRACQEWRDQWNRYCTLLPLSKKFELRVLVDRSCGSYVFESHHATDISRSDCTIEGLTTAPWAVPVIRSLATLRHFELSLDDYSNFISLDNFNEAINTYLLDRHTKTHSNYEPGSLEDSGGSLYTCLTPLSPVSCCGSFEDEEGVTGDLLDDLEYLAL